MKKHLFYVLALILGSLLFYQGTNVLFVPGYVKVLICCLFFAIAYFKYSGKKYCRLQI